nr:hypothetical protein CFP56_31938 [Quercus suber]
MIAIMVSKEALFFRCAVCAVFLFLMILQRHVFDTICKVQVREMTWGLAMVGISHAENCERNFMHFFFPNLWAS